MPDLEKLLEAVIEGDWKAVLLPALARRLVAA